MALQQQDGGFGSLHTTALAIRVRRIILRYSPENAFRVVYRYRVGWFFFSLLKTFRVPNANVTRRVRNIEKNATRALRVSQF